MKKRLVFLALLLGSASIFGAQSSSAPTQDLEKQREALSVVDHATNDALKAMNHVVATLNPLPLVLPSSRKFSEAQEMVDLGIPADAYFKALDALLAVPESALPPTALDRGALATCRDATRRLLQTKALSAAEIDVRMRSDHPEFFQTIQESKDLQYSELLRAMQVAGWLGQETEAVLTCLPPLQKQLSQTSAGNARRLMQIDDQLMLRSVEAANAPPPAPQTKQ